MIAEEYLPPYYLWIMRDEIMWRTKPWRSRCDLREVSVTVGDVMDSAATDANEIEMEVFICMIVTDR